MAFTPDGIAPPGIPLLDSSPPHHDEAQNGLWGSLAWLSIFKKHHEQKYSEWMNEMHDFFIIFSQVSQN